MARLELEGVSRHFFGVQAVKDLSMAVAPGRITGPRTAACSSPTVASPTTLGASVVVIASPQSSRTGQDAMRLDFATA